MNLANNIVTVRMPESLMERLKELAEKGHYLGLSEEIRSIMRKRWLEYSSQEDFSRAKEAGK